MPWRHPSLVGSVGSMRPGGWRRLEVWLADSAGAVPAAPSFAGDNKVPVDSGCSWAQARCCRGAKRQPQGTGWVFLFLRWLVPKEKLCMPLKAGAETWIYFVLPLARKESVLVQFPAFQVGFGM